MNHITFCIICIIMNIIYLFYPFSPMFDDYIPRSCWTRFGAGEEVAPSTGRPCGGLMMCRNSSMEVSINGGTQKKTFIDGFSTINHPAFGYPKFRKALDMNKAYYSECVRTVVWDKLHPDFHFRKSQTSRNHQLRHKCGVRWLRVCSCHFGWSYPRAENEQEPTHINMI